VFILNDPPPPELSTLSLHDALPISPVEIWGTPSVSFRRVAWVPLPDPGGPSSTSRINRLPAMNVASGRGALDSGPWRRRCAAPNVGTLPHPGRLSQKKFPVPRSRPWPAPNPKAPCCTPSPAVLPPSSTPPPPA